MKKLTVVITYKGKEYIRVFADEKMTMDYDIHVLLSNKDNKNNYGLARYHYICKLYSNSMIIPETSMIPHETAFINIKLVSPEFYNLSPQLRKDWKLPLHAIGCQKDVFPLDREYFICFMN